MPRRPLPRTRMRLRKALYWLREIRWWAVMAVITGLLAVVLAVADRELAVVLAVAGLAITLAILSTNEEPT